MNSQAIRLDRLGYIYPDGTRALEDVSLEVSAGERVALLGPNGAGKSTLILHLNGILLPSEGAVEIAGIVMSDETVSQIRSNVGLVFQDPDDQLFMTSVYDDVAFGPLNMGLSDDEVSERAHQSLHDVGLAELSSKPGQHLSFGQRKRAALATVLSMDPEILVLDEPTSNLDPLSKRSMVELLGDIDKTLLIATHDMDVAWSLCDRAVVVDAGGIVADGTRDEIMGDANLLQEHGLELPYQARS
jgi:cobalt/nickel transport system ATP-binding protein